MNEPKEIKPQHNLANHDEEFEQANLRELRCLECRALLGHEQIVIGKIKIVCKRCKAINRFIFRDYRNGKMNTVPSAQSNINN